MSKVKLRTALEWERHFKTRRYRLKQALRNITKRLRTRNAEALDVQ